MAYNLTLAQRIREIVYVQKDASERKMFGGICFMIGGNMVCGVVGDELMSRINPENHAVALERPHAKPMEFTGRSMKGYLFIEPEGIRTKRELAYWVNQGIKVAQSIPPKGSKAKKAGASKPKAKAKGAKKPVRQSF